MGQRERNDDEGCWHHLFNRGLARRTVFETMEDVRFFLSRLARVSRRGLLEVHAFCLMLNHFHLLVRSPVGELGRAMQAVANPDSRWFNRRRRPDGPLFRGRFRSRPVESDQYWWTLVRSIDFNPVKAGIAATPGDFPFGSAARYGHPGPHPRWLFREQVEEMVATALPERIFTPDGYAWILGTCPTDQEIELVERRLRFPHTAPDDLDDLLGASSEAVLAWQMRKCALADGTRPGLPVVMPTTVLDLLGAGCDPSVLREDSLLQAIGRLRDACGLTLGDIAQRLGASPASVQRWAIRHTARLSEGGESAVESAALLESALRTDHRRVGVGRM